MLGASVYTLTVEEATAPLPVAADLGLGPIHVMSSSCTEMPSSDTRKDGVAFQQQSVSRHPKRQSCKAFR